jgi:hypothetical protein
MDDIRFRPCAESQRFSGNSFRVVFSEFHKKYPWLLYHLMFSRSILGRNIFYRLCHEPETKNRFFEKFKRYYIVFNHLYFWAESRLHHSIPVFKGMFNGHTCCVIPVLAEIFECLYSSGIFFI